MIPILYGAGTTDFNNNGIGLLADAISCVATEERNGIYELVLSYPITGQHYKLITEGCTIKAKANDLSSPQLFDIYRSSKPIAGVVTFFAEHISYRLTNNPVKPFSVSGVNPTYAINQILSKSTFAHTSTAWSNISTLNSFSVTQPQSIRASLGGVEGSILDVYGGEYEFDNFAIKLHQYRGTDTGVTVRYGKNLTSVEQDKNIQAVYNSVTPFAKYSTDTGEQTVTLAEGYLPLSNFASASVKKSLILDLSAEFNGVVVTQTMLRDKALSYIASHDLTTPKVNIKASFEALWQSVEFKDIAPLERVGLCDTISIIFEDLGVTAKAKVIKTTFDSLAERYNEIELGNAKSNFTSTISQVLAELKTSTNKLAQGQSQAVIDYNKAILDATNAITGQSGGYVVLNPPLNPQEILIIDTDNIATATEVWRWNKGGLGHSKTGYNGPYDTAITQNGAIVADFITAGELNGVIIKAGTIKAESLEIGTEIIDSINQTQVNKTSINNLNGQIALKVSSSQLQPNLLANTSFLDGLNGWLVGGTASQVYVAGDWSWRNGIKAVGVRVSDQTTALYLGVRQQIDVVQGATYSFSCQYFYEYSNTFDGVLQVGFFGRDASGNGIYTSTNFLEVTPIATNNTKWITLTQTATINNPLITKLEVVFRVAKNGTAYMREPMLVMSGTPSAVYSPSLPNMESSIIQQAGLISQKVSANGVISAINQSAETITIQASKIKLEGYTSINNGTIIDTAGNLTTNNMTATNATITGKITATSGAIANFDIAGNVLSSTATLSGTTYTVRIASTINNINTNISFAILTTTGGVTSYPWFVRPNGFMFCKNIEAEGKITATSGKIGGLTIAGDILSMGSGTSYVCIDGSTSSSFAIWAGNTNSVLAPFKLLNNGKLFCTDADIQGKITATSGAIGAWNIGSIALDSSTTISGTEYRVALNGWGAGVNTGWSAFSVATRPTGGTWSYPASITWGGKATFNDAVIRGEINATSGNIGGWAIGSSELRSPSGTIYSGNSANNITITGGGITQASSSGSSVSMGGGQFIIWQSGTSLGYLRATSANDIELSPYGGGSARLLLGHNNNVTKIYGSSITSSKTIVPDSDRRLKHDIKPITSKHIDLISKLSPKTYIYNDDKQNRVNSGFIAQEVLQAQLDVGLTDIDLQLVQEGRDGYLGVDYTQIISLLVGEVQELRKEIKILKGA